MVLVAMVGSRRFRDPLAIVRYVAEKLEPGDVIVSGAAHGPDAWSALVGEVYGHKALIYRADWKKLGRSAGFARNGRIAFKCDRLVAFWDGTSRGTADVMAKAKAYGKPVEVVSPGL